MVHVLGFDAVAPTDVDRPASKGEEFRVDLGKGGSWVDAGQEPQPFAVPRRGGRPECEDR